MVTQDPNQVPAAPVAVGTAPAAPLAPTIAPPTTQVGTAPVDNTPATPTLLPSMNASAVYSPLNVQQVLTGSDNSYKKMSLGKLEDQINNANSTADLNAINIKNQPVAMGVATGEAAHQSALDTARTNAVTGLYNVKVQDQARKDAKTQAFIAQYGADPTKRPEGMSEKEFIVALSAGRFSHLLTSDFKMKQAQLTKELAPAAGSSGTWSTTTDSNGNQVLFNSKTAEIKPMGTVDSSSSQTLSPAGQAIETQITANKGTDGYSNPNDYVAAKDAYMRTATAPNSSQLFDQQFSKYLNPADAQSLGVTITQPTKQVNPNVQNWVDQVSNGNATMQQVPAALKNAVVAALGDDTSPLAKSRMTMAANRIVANFIAMPAYQLTVGGQLYLGRIAAAMKTPGSVSDQDLLDSLTKLNTGGNAVTDTQVKLITDGKSFQDMMSTAYNKVGNGGVLSNQQRKEIQTIAGNIFDNYKSAYQPIYDQATSQLEAAGIPKQYWTIPDLNKLSSQDKGINNSPAGQVVTSNPDEWLNQVNSNTVNKGVSDFLTSQGL